MKSIWKIGVGDEQTSAIHEPAEGEQRALVSLMVKLWCRSAWEKLLIPAFVFFFQKLYPFPRANDDRSARVSARSSTQPPAAPATAERSSLARGKG